MRILLVALGAALVGLIISYGTVVRFAGHAVPPREAGNVLSATLSDALGGSSERNGGKLFMEIERVRPPVESAEASVMPVSPRNYAPREAAKSKVTITPSPAPKVLVGAARVEDFVSSSPRAPTSAPAVAPSVALPAPPSAREPAQEACDFSERKQPNHLVLLNEIAWMGSPQRGGEDGVGGAQGEWIELKNNAGRDMNLNGWRILNKTGKFKIELGATAELPEGGYFLLERGDDETVPDVPAGALYAGVLSNNGEWLRLFDARCALVDEVNASLGWPAGENVAKKTMERSAVDLSWSTSGVPGGTAGRANSAMYARNSPPLHTASPAGSAPPLSAVPLPSTPTSTPSPAPTSTAGEATSSSTSTLPVVSSSSAPSAPSVNHIVIAAVQITGGTGLSSNDFVKLLNPTANAIDIGGWKLRKRAQTGSESSVRVFAAGHLIPAGGYFTWANSGEGFAASLGANESSTQTIAANNSIAFLNPDGAVVDALAWGEGHTNPFIEGAAYATNPEGGQKLTRKAVSGAVQDTDNNAADFEMQ